MSANRPKDALAYYVPVAERIEKFHARYPEGRILTAIVTHELDSGFILIRAEVYRFAQDTSPSATGHAYEVRGEGYVNKSSYIENAETGAVGRALAILGFEVKRGLASREEMEKVQRMVGNPDSAAKPEYPERREDVVAAPHVKSQAARSTASPPPSPTLPAANPLRVTSERAEVPTASAAAARPSPVIATREATTVLGAEDDNDIFGETDAATAAATPTLNSPVSLASGGRLPKLQAVSDATSTAANEEQKTEILNLLENLRPRDRRAQRALLLERTGKGSRDDLTAAEAKRLIEELRGK